MQKWSLWKSGKTPYSWHVGVKKEHNIPPSNLVIQWSEELTERGRTNGTYRLCSNKIKQLELLRVCTLLSTQAINLCGELGGEKKRRRYCC